MQVRYLGNVLTAFVKGEGCVDRPTQVLWNNYVTNCASSSTGNAGLDMELTVCGSGLKVVIKEQGLTDIGRTDVVHATLFRHTSFRMGYDWENCRSVTHSHTLRRN